MSKRKKTTRGNEFNHSSPSGPNIPQPSDNGKPVKKKKVPKYREERRKKRVPNKTIFPSVGLPQYTLLDIPDRANLPAEPPGTRPSILVQIVTETPDLYKKLITLIRMGAAGHVAAERLGISEKTFYEWARIGRQELQQAEPPDTYYTRFYTDIRRAVAMKRSEIEIEVAATEPKKWLSHGPGRIFGDNWSDKPPAAPPPPELTESAPQQTLLPPGNNSDSTSSSDSSNASDSVPATSEVDGSAVGDYNIISTDVSMDALEELQREG